MNIDIHVYLHILTGDMAALEAEIAALKAEAPTPEDLTALDALETEAIGFRPGEPVPPAPTP